MVNRTSPAATCWPVTTFTLSMVPSMTGETTVEEMGLIEPDPVTLEVKGPRVTGCVTTCTVGTACVAETFRQTRKPAARTTTMPAAMPRLMRRFLRRSARMRLSWA